MISIAFYCFASLLLAAAIMVVTLQNAVHSVLFLVFAFLNAAALFIMIGAEYVAMTMIIVYVGAIAVLFLFIVMMIDSAAIVSKRKILQVALLTGVLCAVVFFEISLALDQSVDCLQEGSSDSFTTSITNTEAIGYQLYTDYVLQFQLSGLILLVAMIGAILLTMEHSKGVKRQSTAEQVRRSREQSVALVDAQFNTGVKLK